MSHVVITCSLVLEICISTALKDDQDMRHANRLAFCATWKLARSSYQTDLQKQPTGLQPTIPIGMLNHFQPAQLCPCQFYCAYFRM